MKKISDKISYRGLVITCLSVFILFSFYWLQIRPAHIRSACADWSLTRSKADTLYLHDEYTSGNMDDSYDYFLKMRMDVDKKFKNATYDQEDYKTYYSRCLNEHGI